MRQTVLITGALGFMGSSLARRLLAEGCEVNALLRPDTRRDATNKLPGGVIAHVHDGGTEGLHEILKAIQPQTVFHTGALFIAEHQPDQVEALIQGNVLYSTQLADAAVAAGVRNFVNVGTSWQHYGDADYDPSCLYAVTKQAFEAILAYYASAHGLRVATTVIYDTYGPGDDRPKLLRLLRRVALSGEALGMSPGEQKLDLVHIDDVVDALVMTATWLEREGRDGVMERFGIFSGEALSVRELVVLVGEIMGRTLNVTWGGRPYRKREVMAPHAYDKLRPAPGWRAKTPLRDGLRQTLLTDTESADV